MESKILNNVPVLGDVGKNLYDIRKYYLEKFMYSSKCIISHFNQMFMDCFTIQILCWGWSQRMQSPQRTFMRTHDNSKVFFLSKGGDCTIKKDRNINGKNRIGVTVYHLFFTSHTNFEILWGIQINWSFIQVNIWF